MGKNQRKKPGNKPAKKQAAVRANPPPDATQIVADIVDMLTDKKFGPKLSEKSTSRTNGNQD
jgi:hypothetical protein